jgi:Protein of unknown function (DUF3311)
VTNQPHGPDSGNGGERARQARGRAWYLLFLIPMAATLIPPIYNTKDPTLIGIPFFYWYLMAWVLATVVLMVIVNRFTEDDR